jgi:hypothetical protein
MNSKHHRLIDALPELAEELIALLKGEGEDDLAAQIPELLLVDRCRCGDYFCSTVYTALPPKGAYGPGHDSMLLDAEQGWIVIDTMDRKIVEIEILDRDDVRKRVL